MPFETIIHDFFSKLKSDVFKTPPEKIKTQFSGNSSCCHCRKRVQKKSLDYRQTTASVMAQPSLNVPHPKLHPVNKTLHRPRKHPHSAGEPGYRSPAHPPIPKGPKAFAERPDRDCQSYRSPIRKAVPVPETAPEGHS